MSGRLIELIVSSGVRLIGSIFTAFSKKKNEEDLARRARDELKEIDAQEDLARKGDREILDGTRE